MPVGRPQFPGGGRYRRLAPALKKRFGQPVHKVTLRGGFGCPNRDGRIGTGGCIFCSEMALLPSQGPIYGPVETQLETGLAWVLKHHAIDKVIAYFQDQTATDAPLETLADLYTRAISHPQVVALSVGTRPDWIESAVFELLSGLAKKKPVLLELGLQSANDAILRSINRGHKVLDFERAVQAAHAAGLEVVAHVILGLPGESQDDRVNTALCLNRLQVQGVKIHNLHVLADTPLARQVQAGKVLMGSLLEYAHMAAEFLRLLDPNTVIHRLTGQGPASLMLAPTWAGNKGKIIQSIERLLDQWDAWQGQLHPGAQPWDRSGRLRSRDVPGTTPAARKSSLALGSRNHHS